MNPCPVNIYQFYLSKLNKGCDKLFQKPKKEVHYTDEEWFERRGLELFMKTLMTDAKLTNKEYTNHSIRSTVVSNLDRSGFEARHITTISGHKSEATIKEYSVKCPDVKKREMCDALAGSIMQPKKFKQGPSTSTNSIVVSDELQFFSALTQTKMYKT